jgi:transcriptional/translational regulatory protein YebC/TACO1
MTNLPSEDAQRFSDRDVKDFFDDYRQEPVSFSSNQLDSVVNFFSNRGFDETAAIATASVLLEQAKRDSVNVFKLIDTLKGLDDVELSNIVTEILNYSRPKTSSLGYKKRNSIDLFEKRNIVP